jgi:hypothetical protein
MTVQLSEGWNTGACARFWDQEEIAMRIAAPILIASALAACAAPPAPLPAADAVAVAGPACFRAASIRGHTFGDDKTMYLKVQGDGVYRIGMRNACLAGATSSDPIVTRQPPGSSYICRPIDMDIAVAPRGGDFTSPCIVDSIAQLTPAEIEALPPRLRP